MKKPDIFKTLDVERKGLLRLPGNALKVWLYYRMREGQERLAWATEKDICSVTGLHRDVMYDNRRWLVKNGWLKPMSVRKRAHGEYATQVFRVKEGTVPEKKDRRKGNNPTSARLGRARLEQEAIEEFVGSLPMGNASEKSRQDASVTNLREQSEQIREELDTEEVDTVEVEPMLVSSLVSSSPSLRSGSSDSADASLSHESQNQNRNGLGAVTEPKEPNCYAMLPEQVKLVAGAVCTNQNLPGYFGLSFFTNDHDEPIARMASILYARNRSAFWLELLVQWAKKHKFWKTRLHNGERAVAQLVKFMETGDICEQFDAHLNVTSKGEALKARNDRHGNAYLLRNDE